MKTNSAQECGSWNLTEETDWKSPQGSVLGPLLLLIYINDQHKCIKYSKTYYFANDTTIIQSQSANLIKAYK